MGTYANVDDLGLALAFARTPQSFSTWVCSGTTHNSQGCLICKAKACKCLVLDRLRRVSPRFIEVVHISLGRCTILCMADTEPATCHLQRGSV
jgi:hypothetical protein